MATWETRTVPGVEQGVYTIAEGVADTINFVQTGSDSLNNLLTEMVDSAESTSSIQPITYSSVTFTNQLNSVVENQQNVEDVYNGIITKTITVPPDSTETSGVGAVRGADSFSFSLPEPPDMLAIDVGVSTPPPAPDITFNKPSTPGLSQVSASFSSAPPSASVGSVSEISIGVIPTLTATAPTVGSIARPNPFSKSVPTGSDLPEHALPAVTTDIFPDEPNLHALTLPTPPTLNLVDFDGVLPAPLEEPPETSFNFSEVAYGSPLNTELKEKFLDYLDDQVRTSLEPSIEQQQWDQFREEQAMRTRESVAAIKRSYAQANWSQPTGREMEDVFSVFEKSAVVDIKASREITKAQLKLELDNLHFNIGKALEYEGQLINLHNEAQQRSLEAAIFVIDSAVGLYEIKVDYLKANISLYVTQAEVYNTRIQAEISKVEIFKAQLEGLKLIGDLNQQDIDLYKARVQAVVATFELYQLELMGVKTQIESDSLKVQNFGAAIKAFSAEVKAKTLEFDGYTTALTGEEIKAKIYDSLVSAYSKEVVAYKAEVGALAKKLDADVKVNVTAPVEISKQNLDAFSALVDAEMARVDAITDHNKDSVRLYSEEVDCENVRVKSEVDIYKSEVDAYRATIDRDSTIALAKNESNKAVAKIFETQVEATSDILKAAASLEKNKVEVSNININRAESIGLVGAEYNQIHAGAIAAAGRASVANARTTADIHNTQAMVEGAAFREAAAVTRVNAIQAVSANARASAARVSQIQIAAQQTAAVIGIRSFSDNKTWTNARSMAKDNYSSGSSVTRTTVHSE